MKITKDVIVHECATRIMQSVVRFIFIHGLMKRKNKIILKKLFMATLSPTELTDNQ